MSQRPKYSKEGGTASINGHYYEIKTCALMYLLALNSESEDFLIASNFKALEEKNVGHDFQDLGLMFIDKETKWNPLYYQMKHVVSKNISLASLTNRKSKNDTDFSLPLYYQWVQKLWTKSKNVFPNEDDATFILFTNAGVEEGLEIVWEEDTLLRPLSSLNNPHLGRYFVINEKCQNIIDCLPGDDLNLKEKFLRQLRIYPNQPGVKELDDIIKKQLLISFNLNSDECDLMYLSFFHVIGKWWERGNKCCYLTRSDKLDIWKSSRITFTNVIINNFTKNFVEHQQTITDYGFFYEQDENLYSTYNSCNVLNIVTDKGTTELTCLKICQNLNLNTNDCVILKIDYFLNDSDVILLSWLKSNRPVILILCDVMPDNFNAEILFPLFIDEKGYNYFTDFNINYDIDRKIIFVDLPVKMFKLLKDCFSSVNSNENKMSDKNCNVNFNDFDLFECDIAQFDLPTTSSPSTNVINAENNMKNYEFGEIPLNSNFDQLLDVSQDEVLGKEIEIEHPNGVKTQTRLKELNPSDLQHIKKQMHIQVLWTIMQNKSIKILPLGSESAKEWVVSCGNNEELYPLIEQVVDISKNLTNLVSSETNRYVDTFSAKKSVKTENIIDYFSERFNKRSGNVELSSYVSEFLNKSFNSSLVNIFDKLLEEAENPNCPSDFTDFISHCLNKSFNN